MSERTYRQATADYLLYITVFICVVVGSYVVGASQGYENGFEDGVKLCQEDN